MTGNQVLEVVEEPEQRLDLGEVVGLDDREGTR